MGPSVQSAMQHSSFADLALYAPTATKGLDPWPVGWGASSLPQRPHATWTLTTAARVCAGTRVDSVSVLRETAGASVGPSGAVQAGCRDLWHQSS